MQAEKVRIHSFAHGDKMRHDHDANLSAEKAYYVKESGESQRRLRLRQSTGKNSLQNDRGNQTDKCERLPDPNEQFNAIVICSRPRTGISRIKNYGRRNARESRRHQKARIEALEKQRCRNESDEKLRRCSPKQCRTNLVRFESVNC